MWSIYGAVSWGFFNFLCTAALLRAEYVLRFLKPILYMLLSSESVKDALNRLCTTGASGRAD